MAIETTPELLAEWELVGENAVRSLDRQDWETEVGDVMQPDFYPQVKVKRWNNDANFSMRWALQNFTPDEFRTEQNRIIFRRGNIVARFRLKPGGLDFDILLLAAPPQNFINFTVNTKNVVLHHQPPLGAEPGNRPDNVINSIAVYHSTKRGNQFQTGKLFHLYRPRAFDSSTPTQSVWGRWDIVDANTIRMTIPQAALDAAVYPVLIT